MTAPIPFLYYDMQISDLEYLSKQKEIIIILKYLDIVGNNY